MRIGLTVIDFGCRHRQRQGILAPSLDWDGWLRCSHGRGSRDLGSQHPHALVVTAADYVSTNISLPRNNPFKIALLVSANEIVHQERGRTPPCNIILGDSTTQWRSGAMAQWRSGKGGQGRSGAVAQG